MYRSMVCLLLHLPTTIPSEKPNRKSEEQEEEETNGFQQSKLKVGDDESRHQMNITLNEYALFVGGAIRKPNGNSQVDAAKGILLLQSH